MISKKKEGVGIQYKTVGGGMEVIFSDVQVKKEELEEVLEKSGLREIVNEREMPFTKLMEDAEIKEILEGVKRIKERSSTLVVVGMGGSSRGAKAVNEAVGKDNGNLKFIDNVDPNLINKVLNELNWEESSFVFISKSGRTLETVTALNLILKELKERKLPLGKKCTFIGDAGNPFEDLSKKFGAPFFKVPKEVGGRFSVFTPVGIFPLAFGGYRVDEFLEGAKEVVREPEEALKLAAAKFIHYKDGRKISVAMPYSSFMTEFTEWYVQLWGESLGKNGKGQTPLKAVGTSSQHAILQLFVDGPDDKFYQLFFVESYEVDPKLPEEVEILPYLSGKRISEVMEAEFLGTLHALRSRKRPIVTFKLENLSERELGRLMMFYMISVVAMGKLMGVNPYGQPAVEIGKRVAREILLKGREDGAGKVQLEGGGGVK